jgi:hypothetical protein
MDSVADKKKKFVETTAQIPTKVVRVNVEGLAATRDVVITSIVSELFNVKVTFLQSLQDFFQVKVWFYHFRLTLIWSQQPEVYITN